MNPINVAGLPEFDGITVPSEWQAFAHAVWLALANKMFVTPVNAVAAALSTNLTGDNNDLVFTAKTKGAAGNSLKIVYVDPGAETASESVHVDGNHIIVTLRSVSSVLSTAAEVVAAIEADAEADALVAVTDKAANDGTGVVTAMAAASLAGGVNGTVAPAGAIYVDDSYVYVASAANTISDANWKKVAIS